ncbi:MAG TPA: universal stress protein [Chitinophagaceae bacterium]|jgi:nucleotide-binding universal stress UspA family protein
MDIKKILVPTDFSNAANNALLYATIIAEQYGAQIDILHAFTIPVLTARGNPVLTDPDVAQANRQVAEGMLKKTKKIVSRRSPVKFNLTAIPIYWQIELAEVIHNQQADLIVMGTTGASGLKKIFMGSNAARVIQNLPGPVLAVPEQAKLSEHTKIGLAYDGLQIKEFGKLSIVNSLKNTLNASIYVFQIIENKQSSSPYLSELINFLSGARVDYIYESEIESAILKCIELNHLDMLVMIPRLRGFFYNLVTGSMTKKIAYKIPIPLLAIPE